MIVAIYATVSSERQKETEAISSQAQELQEFAAREGLAIDERNIYCGEGESGSYLDRLGLNGLRDAARNDLIESLIVQNPDRLARRQAVDEKIAKAQMKLDDFSRIEKEELSFANYSPMG